MAKLFVILSPVDRYHGNLDDGITLLADPRYVRAFYGGVGAYKLAWYKLFAYWKMSLIKQKCCNFR